MNVDTRNLLSMAEAKQDFSRAARIADRDGQAVIIQDDRPKYVLIDLDTAPLLDLTEDEKIDIVARRVLNRHREAFEELAK